MPVNRMNIPNTGLLRNSILLTEGSTIRQQLMFETIELND